MANKALDFNGVSGDVTVTDALSIQNIFDGGGTIECWINPRSDGESNEARVIGKNRWQLWVDSEAASKIKLTLYQVFSGDDGRWRTTATEVTINVWSHITVTYNASSADNNAIFYVNGSVVTSGETFTPTLTRTSDTGSDLIIGNRSGDDKTFDGTIDEVRLYTRILGSTEVTANYNGGAGRHWPSNMNNLVAWWHMDEGTGASIFDWTSGGNTGAIITAAWVDGFDFKIMKNVPRR